MRKTVLLPGLCLLLCTCVRGIQKSDFDRIWTEPEGFYDYSYNPYAIQPAWYYDRDEFPDPEEENILNVEILKILVEDVEKAAREIASETASDQEKRITFGKLGHLIKPIKQLQSWLHKPHKPHKSPDLSLDLGAEIVVQPPAESSEQEE